VSERAAEPPTFEVHDDVPPEGAIVDHGLGDFNDRAAPLRDVLRLSCFARVEGEVVGGAIGRTWGACCELQQVWVDERFRGRGIASGLVRRFEARARARGCTTFYLETFSFQAPELYRRLGYSVAHEIRGFPDGIVKYLMVREAGG
jgi:GNAT superfamily N-acetyltransferase